MAGKGQGGGREAVVVQEEVGVVRTAIGVGADLAHLAPVRDEILRQVASWDVPVDRSIVRLLVSELVANAVEHGAPPIEASVDWDDHRLRVEVRDGSASEPVHRRPSLVDAGGRGIWLVDRHASAWGVDRTASGKAVWFELRRP